MSNIDVNKYKYKYICEVDSLRFQDSCKEIMGWTKDFHGADCVSFTTDFIHNQGQFSCHFKTAVSTPGNE